MRNGPAPHEKRPAHKDGRHTVTRPPADLLAAAEAAFHNAYAPYSEFPVGAALRTATGAVYAGANVENGAYGLTRCAEQSAVQAMASDGGRSITELVVYTAASPPASPCGACRQILAEFSSSARVWLVNTAGETVLTGVAELLPRGFTYGGPAG